jgi:hypothetical protein
MMKILIILTILSPVTTCISVAMAVPSYCDYYGFIYSLRNIEEKTQTELPSLVHQSRGLHVSAQEPSDMLCYLKSQ